MHRSSKSIAALAAALAKAQAELINPEKTQVAHHRDRRKPKLRAIFSLRAAVERTGNCAQNSGAARHRCHPNHRDRQRYRDGET